MTDHERPLPKQVDVVRFAQQGAVLKGCLAVSELPRLVAVLSDATTILHPVLHFAVDEEGRRTANSRLQTQLSIVCQRCLKAMPYEVTSDVNVAFVTTDEQAKQLPAHLEPVMMPVDSSLVNLYDMLEDELLLSLPMAALHDHCEGAGSVRSFGEQDVKASATERPFAALTTLLGKKPGKK
jgi:uncharacterized protein